MHDHTALSALTEDSLFTAVLLASGGPRGKMQPQSTPASHAVHAAPSVSVPTAIDAGNCASDGVLSSPSTSAVAAAASGNESAACSSSPAKSLTPSLALAPLTIKEGARVRIEGLQTAPHMNGRTGVICGEFDQQSGRWTVKIAADGARPASRGSFRAANLHLIPSHNFGTEWVDEDGCVWPKDVNFSHQCAKGHALVPLGDCSGVGGGPRLMCRLCHSFCGRDCHEAASWLICSDHVSCCGEYAVCSSCVHAPSAAPVVCAGSDNFHTLVSCGSSAA